MVKNKPIMLRGIKMAHGLDSRPFDIQINGVHTKWNMSIRCWTGDDGRQLCNPMVLCLNLLSCSGVAEDGNNENKYSIKFNFDEL